MVGVVIGVGRGCRAVASESQVPIVVVAVRCGNKVFSDKRRAGAHAARAGRRGIMLHMSLRGTAACMTSLYPAPPGPKVQGGRSPSDSGVRFRGANRKTFARSEAYRFWIP